MKIPRCVSRMRFGGAQAPLFRLVALAAAAAMLPAPAPRGDPALAQTVNSVVIWPIDPVIKSDERAVALWLENPGHRAVVLQVRVFRWSQATGENLYAAQKDVIGTPPIARIEPGKRQLVRLTRVIPRPDAAETAFRVIIDEIPSEPAPAPASTSAATASPAAGAGAAIRFRMRYSLPLFVHGGDDRRDGENAQAVTASLVWRIERVDGAVWLEIRNHGQRHARLSGVGFTADDGKPRKLAKVTGYVLPGAAMRWRIDQAPPQGAALSAAVNGGAPSLIRGAS